ncbi:helix-turn-helix domain-containing protein [Mesorhizobium sp. VK25A]|uniref:Helix-turn-helix domain-containing protein n=1 Tax=Mesorhizobium vachelliae TaxID=3072309 RepID=A0ABU5A3J2_9HYPH|nr:MULTISPECIES: helix-turn-helix domain-containing protein [unclassified Mesorhizobium]MDX8530818.1 helix-turn-helix domain-containing protein [Mesorhizobium sp. VK25D]MDX8543431.1 helix-turn-helix domain-containing protein [Mesorhizobium sp. VK25A]
MSANSFEPADSFRLRFEDPERFAAAIPGGRFGALPLAPQAFKAGIRFTNFGGGVSVRAVSSDGAMVFRSELAGYNPPSIVYILPSLIGSAALLDGREVNNRSIASRIGGHTPVLRTYGLYEAGTVTIFRETFREAAAALMGHDYGAALLSPTTTVEANPARISQLSALHHAAGQLLTLYTPQELESTALPGVKILRDRIVAALVSALGELPMRPDHMARQLQTISMAKIDRFIEENQHKPVGLQEMCDKTGLALRTVETIVRSRTDMSPLDYLRRRRFARAYRSLRYPRDNTTVTHVALDNGFLHLGRFSIQYRELYGESPITTLRKARGY